MLYVPKVIILGLGPIQPLLHWVLGFFLQSRMVGGTKLTTRLHLVSRFRMNGAIPPLPLYAFMTWTMTTLTLPLTLFQTEICVLGWSSLHSVAVFFSVTSEFDRFNSLNTGTFWQRFFYGADIFPELTKHTFLRHLFACCAHCCCKFCCVVLLWKIYTAFKETRHICWYTSLQNWSSYTDTNCSWDLRFSQWWEFIL